MPLVVRTHNYVSGALIVASQNNTNETTLFNLVNGNLDVDNFVAGGVNESLVNFDTSGGHEHDGSDSKAINISGTGPLMQVTTTGADHGFIGTSSSSSAHAGVRGVSSHSASYGGSFENSSTGIGIIATSTGGGNPLYVENRSGDTGLSSIIIKHQSTTSAKAAIEIVEATSTGYGILIFNPVGIGLRITRSSAATASISLGGGTSVPHIDVNQTGSGVGLKLDMDGAGEGIELDASGASTEGMSIIMGANTNYAIVTTGDTGISGGINIDGACRFAGVITMLDTVVHSGAIQHTGSLVGFYGETPTTRLTVVGARDDFSALQSLLTHLDTIGIITDSSTAS